MYICVNVPAVTYLPRPITVVISLTLSVLIMAKSDWLACTLIPYHLPVVMATVLACIIFIELESVITMPGISSAFFLRYLRCITVLYQSYH